jgi:hypothetical protein
LIDLLGPSIVKEHERGFGSAFNLRRVEMITFTFRHGPITFAYVLLIIVLCVADSFLTIDIVSRGGQELNPIMAYYLNQSPLLFFIVKYLITCAAIMMILSIKNNYIRGIRIRAEVFLVSFFIALALVVQWQLFLIHSVTD